MKRLSAALALACAALATSASAAVLQVPAVKNSAGQLIEATPTVAVDSTGTAISASNPLPIQSSGAGLSASPVTPVTCALTATGTCGPFTPAAGRPFNDQLSGTFIAGCQLERQINSVWAPLTVSAGGSVVQVESWTAPASDSWVEYQTSIPYRVNCTSYTSGTVNISLSQ